ncbi:hypothetical protein BS17DRAFT_452243 [Gyrodon lividus]|nr:hypothetical protein BS17DRAFT_452243 [Gyrodon lividus]
MHRRTPSNQPSLPPHNIRNFSPTNPSSSSSSSWSLFKGTMNNPPLPVTCLLRPFSPPRKHRRRHRTAFLALLGLVAFTCYLVFISNPTLDMSKSLRTHVQAHDRVHGYDDQSRLDLNPDQQTIRHETPPYRKIQQYLQAVPVPPPRSQIYLSPSEELAALAAFLAALPHNVLPPSVDPSQPLDPQLVLDFDTRSERAKEELHQVVEEVWTRYPVMLFTKVHILLLRVNADQ